jgi:hypothetical protein
LDKCYQNNARYRLVAGAGIEQALGKLMDVNPRNDRAAAHRLGTFIKKVEGFHRRNILDNAQADALAAAADEIIALLANA